MKSIELPRASIRVSRFSFGTASLHHLPTQRSRLRLLSTAADSGFTHFDTSPLYGNGIAEEELGRFFRLHGRDLTVATKVGLYAPHGAGSNSVSAWSRKLMGKVFSQLSRPVTNWSIAQAEISLDRSLRRLGRDCVDILFMHEPGPGLFDTDEWLEWFGRQQRSGKIKKWGLAGPVLGMAQWLSSGHPLADVLQVRDGLASKEADALQDNKREMQFTYGYLSEKATRRIDKPAEHILRSALSRNATGSIVVSTRRSDRIPILAGLAS